MSNAQEKPAPRVPAGARLARSVVAAAVKGFRSRGEGKIGFVPRPRRQQTGEGDRPQFSPFGVETKPESPRLSAPPEVAPQRRVPARFPGPGVPRPSCPAS